MVGRPSAERATKSNPVQRIMYSALGLTLIGSAVAVLAAPLKWS
jgi:hypothetical protein